MRGLWCAIALESNHDSLRNALRRWWPLRRVRARRSAAASALGGFGQRQQRACLRARQPAFSGRGRASGCGFGAHHCCSLPGHRCRRRNGIARLCGRLRSLVSHRRSLTPQQRKTGLSCAGPDRCVRRGCGRFGGVRAQCRGNGACHGHCRLHVGGLAGLHALATRRHGQAPAHGPRLRSRYQRRTAGARWLYRAGDCAGRPIWLPRSVLPRRPCSRGVWAKTGKP